MKTGRMVWMDLEMTGLDPERERIIEIAALITDAELNVVAEGPNLVVHQAENVLSQMDDWNKKHHGESGLLERVRASTLSEQDADEQVARFLTEHTSKRKAPLAGNSIHQDRRFLQRYMPKIDGWLHYRLVDVSTVKELALRWYPKEYEARPNKKGAHRALDDIHESLAELRYYRKHLFRRNGGDESAGAV